MPTPERNWNFLQRADDARNRFQERAPAPPRPAPPAASAAGVRLAPGAGELGLDGLRDLGQLGEDVDRRLRILACGGALELGSRLLEAREQLLGAPERVLARNLLGVHAASVVSRWIRARMPFTSRPASSLAYRFARPTASLIA